MSYWLLKTEPDVYSYADLDREKKTVWDGVANNLALIHIRSMEPGDLALIYHTGKERKAVGIGRVVSLPYADRNLSDPKRTVVDIEAVEALPQSVALSTIKADPFFADFDLVRISRLSVVPVSSEQWAKIMNLAQLGMI